jgi:hypothetical protein
LDAVRKWEDQGLKNGSEASKILVEGENFFGEEKAWREYRRANGEGERMMAMRWDV